MLVVGISAVTGKVIVVNMDLISSFEDIEATNSTLLVTQNSDSIEINGLFTMAILNALDKGMQKVFRAMPS